MFKNIGKQIKLLARIFFWSGLGVTWFTGLHELFSVDGWMILVSLIVSVTISGFVYIISLFVYAFGELVDCVSSLKRIVKYSIEN